MLKLQQLFNIKFTAFLNYYLTAQHRKIIIFPPRQDFYPWNNICFLECSEDLCSHADPRAVWPVPGYKIREITTLKNLCKTYLSKLTKIWPLIHVPSPTFLNNQIQIRMAMSRSLQSITVPHPSHHLASPHPRVWGGSWNILRVAITFNNIIGLPSVTISHIRIPNPQTSDLGVKTEKYNDSGAIHLMGSAPFVFCSYISPPKSRRFLDSPKSDIFVFLLWSTRMFRAARSLCIILK